jgi:HEAT repeat protein
MPSLPTSLDLPGVLAVAIILSGLAVGVYLARAFARRGRRQERREGRSLRRLLRRYLRGDMTAEALVVAIRKTQSGRFWASLERLSLGLDRSDWRRLSLALESNPHALVERRRLRDDSPWRRELAARRLGLLRSRTSRRALRAALRKGPELVTLAAGMSLARYRDLESLRWLIAHPQMLARRPRRSVAALLAAFGRRGLPEIAAALEHGIREPVVELAAMDVLGAGRYRGARDRLERLLNSGDLEHRIAAARALGLLQAVECATSLLGALRDEAWQVRAQAARALGRVRAPIAVTALAARLTDSSWWVRRHAAYALYVLGADGQAALRRIAESSDDPYARDMAHEVLEGGVRLDVA